MTNLFLALFSLIAQKSKSVLFDKTVANTILCKKSKALFIYHDFIPGTKQQKLCMTFLKRMAAINQRTNMFRTLFQSDNLVQIVSLGNKATSC